MSASNNKPNGSSDPQRRSESDTPLPREQLPPSLQTLVDDDDSLLDQLYEGRAQETTDSNLRYAAYATRLRTILLSAHRYVAYTSDIGESFRPVAHPWLIKSAYGVSWAYLIGDVGHEGYKAYLRNQAVKHPGVPGTTVSADASDARGRSGGAEYTAGRVPRSEDYRAIMAQRAVFQGVASMGLPAFTIHSIVRYSGRALKDAKNLRIRTYGPIGLGLAAVPFLPFLFDKPVEHATEWTFHKAFETFGGPEAVAHGKDDSMVDDIAAKAKRKIKEKEL